MVADYIRKYRHSAAREMEFYSQQRSLRDAVDVAARCILPSGKRHPHQYRIPGEALEAARRRLLRADLASTRSFEELHSRVNASIRGIHMIGPLVVYDVSQRIGAYLGHAPRRVYMHAGTRKGARALGLGVKGETLDPDHLPSEFKQLTPAEIEDCLCIYTADLAVARR